MDNQSESRPQNSYGVQLLDDLHTHLPDILYNQSRFHTIGDVLDYVSEVAMDRDAAHFSESRGRYNGATILSPTRLSLDILRNSEPLEAYFNEDGEDGEDEEDGEDGEDDEGEDENDGVSQNSEPTTLTRNRRVRSRDSSEERLTQRPRLSFHINQDNVGILHNILQMSNSRRTINYAPFFGLSVNQYHSFMEPVVVTPSSPQITVASTTYSADGADAEFTCTICQDRFTVGENILRIDFCSHIFHTPCIRQWFRSSVRCPLCRHDIRDGIEHKEQDTEDGLGSGSESIDDHESIS